MTNKGRYLHLIELLKAHIRNDVKVGVLLLEDAVIALRNPICPLHELEEEGVELFVGKEDSEARNIPSFNNDMIKEKYKGKLVDRKESIKIIFEFDRLVNWG